MGTSLQTLIVYARKRTNKRDKETTFCIFCNHVDCLACYGCDSLRRDRDPCPADVADSPKIPPPYGDESSNICADQKGTLGITRRIRFHGPNVSTVAQRKLF